jgi:hypothetical protein
VWSSNPTFLHSLNLFDDSVKCHLAKFCLDFKVCDI